MLTTNQPSTSVAQPEFVVTTGRPFIVASILLIPKLSYEEELQYIFELL